MLCAVSGASKAPEGVRWLPLLLAVIPGHSPGDTTGLTGEFVAY